MIERYEIKLIDNEERLFLYLNMNYEFADLNFINNKDNLEKIIKDYIKRNKITFKGSIVSLIVSGVFIGNIVLNNDKFKSLDINSLPNQYVSESLVLNNNIKSTNNKNNTLSIEKSTINTEENKTTESIIIKKNDNIKKEVVNKTAITKNDNTNLSTNNNVKKENIKNNVDTNTTNNTNQEEPKSETIVDNNIYISVRKSNGTTTNIELEEYVIGVVGAEMPASFNIEALKAQAIIARTYALKAKYKGNNLSDNERTQSYKTNDELKNLWGNNYNTYYNKIKNAVGSTKGMYLAYNGIYIEAVYHSTSNGQTESSVNVWGNYYPYLVTVNSQYDNTNSSFQKDNFISYEELTKKLNMEITFETEFNILSKTASNRVERISINDKIYKGTDFRNLLGLRSADFDIDKNETGITFTTRGYGHGVGLSQYGASGMAKNGYNYKEILSHYYPGTTIDNI